MTLYAGGKDIGHIRAKFLNTLENATALKNESQTLKILHVLTKKRRGLLQKPPENRTTP